MSDDAPAVVGIAVVVLDCADPPALGAWWGRLLGGDLRVDAEGDAFLRLPGGLALDFLRVPEPKSGKNRLHIDLATADLARATEEVVALGATRADDVHVGGSWQVLRDPEGNEFCLLAPRAQEG